MAAGRRQSDTKDLGARTYAEVMQELKAGVLRPLYLLYGEEEFLREHLLRQILDLALAEGAKQMDARVLDLQGKPQKVSFAELRQELQMPAFLSPRRVLVLKNSGLFTPSGNAYAEACVDLLSGVNEYAVLLFVEEKIDKRSKKLLKEVDSRGVRVELSAKDPYELQNWARAFLQRYQIRLTPQAAESLVERCGRSMLQMRNELQKLSLACRREGRELVDETYVDLVCIPDLRGTIFQLTDAIAQQNSEMALDYYRSMISQKTAAQYILFMIARHFRQLLVASSAASPQALMKQLQTGKFVADKLWNQKRKFTKQHLLQIYLLCANSDYGIKSGKIAEEQALELLILQALLPPSVDGAELR